MSLPEEARVRDHGHEAQLLQRHGLHWRHAARVLMALVGLDKGLAGLTPMPLAGGGHDSQWSGLVHLVDDVVGQVAALVVQGNPKLVHVQNRQMLATDLGEIGNLLEAQVKGYAVQQLRGERVEDGRRWVEVQVGRRALGKERLALVENLHDSRHGRPGVQVDGVGVEPSIGIHLGVLQISLVGRRRNENRGRLARVVPAEMNFYIVRVVLVIVFPAHFELPVRLSVGFFMHLHVHIGIFWVASNARQIQVQDSSFGSILSHVFF